MTFPPLSTTTQKYAEAQDTQVGASNSSVLTEEPGPTRSVVGEGMIHR
jgi:hypothetical protein